MTAPAKSSAAFPKLFEEQYRASLRGYARGGGEEALQSAYELGRRAIEAQESLLDLTSIHHKVLSDLVAESDGDGKSAELVRAASQFFAEGLSLYEMEHRGFQDALQALHRLNETLEEEIKRIAYAVHDDASQSLVAIHIALADFSRRLPKPERKQLVRIEHLLCQIEKQLRRYSHELRPTMLDDLGWIPAIRFLSHGVSKRNKLPIRIIVARGAATRQSGAVEIAMYRVVQEALTNVTKHAKARGVSIRIGFEVGTLLCSIEDDGAGFDVHASHNKKGARGLGLIGMRERLHAVGGTLSIVSSPHRGTKLLIRVPSDKESHSHVNSRRTC
ncbi:MAG: ATP-binding protein [Candidatus Acidiferrales bacterium]